MSSPSAAPVRRPERQTVRWTVLGAGAIVPRAGFGCSGHALRVGEGPLTLFDCGPGTLRSLADAGLALSDVRRVVLSHFHPDHCLDVLALAFARRNPAFEAPPIELVGPAGLAAWLERAAALYGERTWLRYEHATVREVDPARPGTLDAGELELAWTATGHTPNALAWRADVRLDTERAASVLYTGDSGENPALAELGRGVDLFVAECSFADGEPAPHHLTPSSAARLARDAGAARLLLTHFYPGLEPDDARAAAARTFHGPIETSRDRSVHVVA